MFFFKLLPSISETTRCLSRNRRYYEEDEVEEEGELDDQLVYEVSAAKMWRGFD